MNQIDWVGTQVAERPFKDIRNTRQTVAEEKACLAKELGELARRIPKACGEWSINRTREFVAAQKAALKVAGSTRSSIPDLTAALANLRRYWGEG